MCPSDRSLLQALAGAALDDPEALLADLDQLPAALRSLAEGLQRTL